MGFEHWAVGFRKKWLGNEMVALHSEPHYCFSFAVPFPGVYLGCMYY